MVCDGPADPSAGVHGCSEHGTIVHTGDWKIDENPVDGEVFDRTTFDLLSE
jgi:mRNA degradation ribonuclease J1/J2